MAKRKNQYVYVSLTAEDFPRVNRYIRAVESAGINVKYDYSIRAWSSHNARSIEDCSAFLVFFSQKSSEDPKVTSEINYAFAHNVPIISVHLEAFTITNGMSRIFDTGSSVLAYNLHPREAAGQIVQTVKDTLGKNSPIQIKTAVISAAVASLVIIFAAASIIMLSHGKNNVETASYVSRQEVQVEPDADTENTGSIESIIEIAKDETLSITVQAPFGQNDPSSKAYKQLLTAYDKKFSNVEFTDTTADHQNYSAAIAKEFENESLPDVFIFNYEMLNSLSVADREQMVDVDTIRKTYNAYGKNIYPGAIQSARDSLTKKCYALPVRGYWEGLFCNTDLFTANNVALPTDWDTMLKAVDAFSENGITPLATSVGIVPNYLTDHLILSAAGHDEYNKTPETYSEIPRSWLTGIGFFKSLYEKKAFPKNTDSLLDTEVTEMFIQKKAAMKVDGSWLCSSLTEAENVTAISFPTVSGGAKTPDDIIGGFSSGWAISKAAWDNPKKREYCVGLIKYLTSEKNLGKFVLNSGAAPGKYETSGTTSLINDGNRISEAALSNARGFSVPLKDRLSHISDFYSNMYDVMAGDMSAEEAFESLLDN